MNKSLIEAFLSLVRLGIGHQSNTASCEYDWNALEDLATRQGLSAILEDGVEYLPENKRPPITVLLQWIGDTFQGYDYRYELYQRTLAEMASFYNSHGYKMMVLKGYACNLDWPKPEHRPCGDIDIWLFGQYKEADVALTQEKEIKIDTSHHHHTVFYWHDFMVENHYNFVNVHSHKSNKKIECILKELGQDDSYSIDVHGEKVYLPSPNLHALFLLRHAMAHFAATELTIRQLLDWAFFVEKHTKDVDWKWLMSVLDEVGALNLFNVFNAICVEDLGFDARIFPTVQYLPAIKDRVLNEILDPEIPNNKPQNLFKRVIWKIKRWKANEWKHKLVYDERMWSSFWCGVWNHLLKPASI